MGRFPARRPGRYPARPLRTSVEAAGDADGRIVPGDPMVMVRWQNRHPSLTNALHLVWLAALILTPIVISQLLYAALE
jgi:hypothetical protein